MLYQWLFFSLPVLYFLSLPIQTNDLAIWVAHGKYLLKSHSILRHDVFSILPTTEFIYPLLTCILYAFADSLGGLIGVSLLHKLALFAILVIWFSGSLSRISNPWSTSTIIMILFSWFGASALCIDRPALLAVLPFLLSFSILNKPEKLTSRDLVLLAVINTLWVNLHGSWIILTGMFLWRECARTFWSPNAPQSLHNLLLGTMSLGFTSLLNPFGYRVFPYILDTVRTSKLRGIVEWTPVKLSWSTSPYFSQDAAYILLCIIVVIFGWHWFNKDRVKFVAFTCSPFCFLLVLGLQSVRNTVLPFAVLPLFAYNQRLIRQVDEDQKSRNLLNTALILCILSMVILFSPTVKPLIGPFLPENKRAVFGEDTPIAVAEYLNHTRDREPIFNEWEYGSFLAYSQSHPIFMDARNVIFAQTDFERYQQVFEVRGDWMQVLRDYRIGYVLLNQKQQPKLLAALQRTKSWQEVFRAGNAILFETSERKNSR